jgi:hypothetical protein
MPETGALQRAQLKLPPFKTCYQCNAELEQLGKTRSEQFEPHRGT